MSFTPSISPTTEHQADVVRIVVEQDVFEHFGIRNSPEPHHLAIVFTVRAGDDLNVKAPVFCGPVREGGAQRSRRSLS